MQAIESDMYMIVLQQKTDSKWLGGKRGGEVHSCVDSSIRVVAAPGSHKDEGVEVTLQVV